MSCRWDRAAEKHLIDGEPCTHDEYGNPVRHCRMQRRCTSHLGWGDYACPLCVGKVRANLEGVLDLMALMPDEAVEQARLDSEALNLAGPHADYVSSQWRLVNADRQGVEVEELDMRDPYTCLTMHERTIREDLGHDDTTLVSPDLASTVGYLTWVLTDLSRSEEGAVSLRDLLGDTARLRQHLETARLNGRSIERGAPCPSCVESGAGTPRLVRHHGHWCDQVGCTRLHYLDDSGDTWRCPSDGDHEWSHADYSAWLDTRTRGGGVNHEVVLPSP